MFGRKFATLKKFYVVLSTLFLSFGATEAITRDDIINGICKGLYQKAPQNSYRCIGAETQDEKQKIYDENNDSITNKNDSVNVLKSEKQPFGYAANDKSLNSSMEVFCDIAIYAVYYTFGEPIDLQDAIVGNKVFEKCDKIFKDEKEIRGFCSKLDAFWKELAQGSPTGAVCNFFNIFKKAILCAYRAQGKSYDEETTAHFYPDNIGEKERQEIQDDFLWYTKNWELESAIKFIIKESGVLRKARPHFEEVHSSVKPLTSEEAFKKWQRENQSFIDKQNKEFEDMETQAEERKAQASKKKVEAEKQIEEAKKLEAEVKELHIEADQKHEIVQRSKSKFKRNQEFIKSVIVVSNQTSEIISLSEFTHDIFDGELPELIGQNDIDAYYPKVRFHVDALGRIGIKFLRNSYDFQCIINNEEHAVGWDVRIFREQDNSFLKKLVIYVLEALLPECKDITDVFKKDGEFEKCLIEIFSAFTQKMDDAVFEKFIELIGNILQTLLKMRPR